MKITITNFHSTMQIVRRFLSLTFFIGLITSIIISPLSSHAQSRSEFERWKQQYLGEFKQYKDQMDKEFADFLQQRWKSFDTTNGVVRDQAPKPEKIPVAKVPPVIPASAKPQTEPVVKAPGIPLPVPPVVVMPPVMPAVPPTPPDGRQLTVGFLGYRLSLNDGFSRVIGSTDVAATRQAIQQRFSALAQSEYPATVQQLQQIRQRLSLNDWAYMRLVRRFAGQLDNASNNQNVLSWFLLLKSGLDARVAYGNGNIYLLVPTQQPLYDIAYFSFDGKKYYDVSRHKKLPQNLYSYNGRYPRQLDAASVSFRRSLQSKPDEKVKSLKFRFAKKDFRIEVPYNYNTVRFLKEYPQMDLLQYFEAPVDSDTANALLKPLAQIIDGMTQTEAVNLLLRFVQTSFRYQTDQDQFGAENYMFVEETVFYPASDCEDRAILFAWLVRELLGLKVVALDFPGHVATAVALKNPVGSIIDYGQVRYSIADPTYINANVGMKMPRYKNINPEVISIP